MTNYYFLAASLPPLNFGRKAEISFEELITRCAFNLRSKDLQKVSNFRTFADLMNLQAFFLNAPHDSRGNFNKKELDEAVLLEQGFPNYVFEFLKNFPDRRETVRFFSAIVSKYLTEEAKRQTGFLRKYFEFEKMWRLVLTVLRGQQLGRSLNYDFQFEDRRDPLIAYVLLKQTLPFHQLPVSYIRLKDQYLSCGADPWEQHREVARWRFYQIQEMCAPPFFSIDWILSYMAQLCIIEDCNQMNQEKGKVILEAVMG